MRIVYIIFFLGAAALVFSVVGPYPVLGAGPMLLGVIALIVVTAGVLLNEPGVGGPTARRMFLTLFPWLFAGLFFANGALDHSDAVLYEMVVVKQDFFRSWDVLTVRSWRPGHTTESLYIKTVFSLRTGRFFWGSCLL